VSLDTVESHKTFCSKDSLTFKLLADPDHKVIDAYGVPVTFARDEEPDRRHDHDDVVRQARDLPHSGLTGKVIRCGKLRTSQRTAPRCSRPSRRPRSRYLEVARRWRCAAGRLLEEHLQVGRDEVERPTPSKVARGIEQPLLRRRSFRRHEMLPSCGERCRAIAPCLHRRVVLAIAEDARCDEDVHTRGRGAQAVVQVRKLVAKPRFQISNLSCNCIGNQAEFPFMVSQRSGAPGLVQPE